MKKKQVPSERRGTFLQTSRNSQAALKRIFRRMLETATLRGESALLRTVFSR